jgi:hypothetical protein
MPVLFPLWSAWLVILVVETIERRAAHQPWWAYLLDWIAFLVLSFLIGIVIEGRTQPKPEEQT